ncbi:MAG: glycosyltransferase [Sumerlaeia bacterium]
MKTPLYPMLHLCVHERGGGAESYLRFLEQGCKRWKTADGRPTVSVASLEGLGAFPLRPSSLPRLRRFFTARHEPIFFLYGLRAQLLASMLAPRDKILVGMIHGEIDFEGRKASIRRLYEGRIRTWVANSEAVLDRKNGCVIENALFDAYSVNSGLPNEREPQLREFETPLCAQQVAFDFGVLASGSPLKGHEFLIELWRKNPHLGKLCFAGNLPNQLVEKASQVGITCLGFVKPQEFFKKIRMLIHPSVSESMPNAIIESLGYGVPVLANPAGGIPSILGELAPEMVLPRALWKNALEQFPNHGMETKAQKLAPIIQNRFDLEPCFNALQNVCRIQLNQKK